MSVQDWGAIGEIIGAVAIIISLLYVGIQIRQNNRDTRVLTSQVFIDTYNGSLNQLIQPGDFRDSYFRALLGLSNLQSSEVIARGHWEGFRTALPNGHHIVRFKRLA